VKERTVRRLHTPAKQVPLQKKTIRRTRVSGLSKDKTKLMVQLPGTNEDPAHPQNVSISEMKRYLIRKHLLENTSVAPVDMIRALYVTAIKSDWADPAK
jgi:hypothetical protein